MINYRNQLINPTDETKCCTTCKHAFIPLDFLLEQNPNPEVFCNVNKDKVISGDVLTEPFNYYDLKELTSQEDAWQKWASINKVDIAGICDLYERVS